MIAVIKQLKNLGRGAQLPFDNKQKKGRPKAA